MDYSVRWALRPLVAALAFFFWIHLAVAQFIPNRYALILEDPPVAESHPARGEARTAAAQFTRLQIETRQAALRAELAARQVQVTGSATTLVNAVFVAASEDRLAELQALPGIKAVVPVRRRKLNMNRAVSLVNAPAAWNMLGGQANGGAGIKIAILDTGIDQTNPAFQDSSLAMPAGFPKCNGDDCNFTSNKVIVARSYVRQLAAGVSASNPAVDSRPDDYTPRDREGHGTAVASVAAGVMNTGAVSFSGMAPKAYLGNYKIYGSPEVNDYSGDDVIIAALEDAVKDDMDIVSFSTGSPAFTGPLDTGSACGLPPAVPCDLSAVAFENAVTSGGLIVVAAAGNDGTTGLNYPSYNTITSPANAPSVIAVGASTNSHIFGETVTVEAAGAPSSLKGMPANPSADGFAPFGAETAPLVDVTKLGDDGLACNPLPKGSLAGAFALIQRGTCNFAAKASNAVGAGAIGIVFYMATPDPPFPPAGLSQYSIPIAMVSQADGLALKSFLSANPGSSVTIDPNGTEQDYPNPNRLASFSSRGPSAGDVLLKPDLVAPGTWIYSAAQNYDPLGFLYSSNFRASADGTSFSTPVVSGAAALVLQQHPAFGPADVKSALVNRASQDITQDNVGAGNTVDVRSIGAGKLDAGAAVNALITASPATLSFGVLQSGSLPVSKALQIANRGGAAANLNVVVSSPPPSGLNITTDKPLVSLPAGGTTTMTVSLAGVQPAPGSYSGTLTLQSAGATVRIPYLIMVASGTEPNMIPLTGSNFEGTVGQSISEGIVSFRLVDKYGIAVGGVPVTWTPSGGTRIVTADSVTDRYGVAAAQPLLGPTPGNYSIIANAGAPSGQQLTFSGIARLSPTISPGGVVNAATFESGSPVAPGSYVAIFGSGLSDTTRAASSARLPLAIEYAFVSFDVPGAGISVPGHLTFASPGQVNVQVPWELQGQSSAQVKVTVSFSNGNVVTVPLSDYAPAFFETAPGVVAALDVNNKVISASNQATRGQVVQLFANGLGPVTNQPASGDPAPLNPLAETRTLPVVMIGNRQAAVGFSGLTPTLPGLYQVNATVPADLTPGTYPITLTIGGKTSKASGLPVK